MAGTATGVLGRAVLTAIILAGGHAAAWAQDESMPDESISDEAISDEAISDEAISDEAISDAAMSDAASAPEAAEIVIAEPIDAPFFVTWLNATIREQPDAASAAVATLEFGDWLTVTGRVEGAPWLRVESRDGTTGYVWAEVLAPVRVATAGTEGGAGGASGPEVGPDGTRQLGPLTDGPVVVQDAVDPEAPEDRFGFDLDGWSQVSVTLTDLVSDADLSLIDSDGQPVGSSSMGGAEPEAIDILLGPGSYVVEVYLYDGRTPYTLTVGATPAAAPPPDEAGDTPETATDLAELPGAPATVEGSVGAGGDRSDVYRVTLTERARLTATLDGLANDADLTLISASGVGLGNSMQGGAAPERVVATLDAGTYYLEVVPYQGYTPYALSVAAEPAGPPPADIAGNEPGTAHDLGTLTARQNWLDEWVGQSDPSDYYRFTLDQTGLFVLSLTPDSADVDVELLSGDGQTYIASSAYGGTMAEGIVTTLQPGTYLVRAYVYGAESGYTLVTLSLPLQRKP